MYDPRVWAEVRLDALKRNVRRVREAIGPRVEILAVIKADAYGHGAVPVARAALEAGATRLGVGDSTEAIELRTAGIMAPILILGAVVEREVDEVIFHGITPTLHSLDRARLFAKRARRHGVRLKVHVMVDTGMGRLGARPDGALKLLEAIATQHGPELDVEGIATHFAAASDPDLGFSLEQLASFTRVLARAKGRGLRIPRVVHAANSAALFRMKRAHFTLVRPGIALYGIDPGGLGGVGGKTGTRSPLTPALSPPRAPGGGPGASPGGEGALAIEPVLSLRSQVVFLKDVPRGTPIGYGATYRTPRATRIATVPLGYNDGYPYACSGRTHVLVRGRRAPLVGSVTMDYLICDVGQVPGVRVGDPVTLIGCDGAESIRVEDLARAAGTIPYTVPCLLGKRVKRLYLGAEVSRRNPTRPQMFATPVPSVS